MAAGKFLREDAALLFMPPTVVTIVGSEYGCETFLAYAFEVY